MLKLKLQSFGHLMRRTDIEDPDAGKDWRQEKKGTTEDEMVGWHHQINGHEFEQAPVVGDGQGSLACCSPWGRKESDMTEQLNWNEWNSPSFGASWVVLMVNNPPVNAAHIRDEGWIAESGRSPGEGNSNPFQYSCLGYSMGRGAWQATVYGLTKEWDTTTEWLKQKQHQGFSLATIQNHF